MKFMQPDPHMGGLGGDARTSTASASNNNPKKDDVKTPTSTTQHEDMLIHHYHTEDETMAAYMDAMAQAQRNGNIRGGTANSNKGLPVQDVEIVDDANAVPTGRTSIEDQVDFAAQSFFDEKDRLEEEAAKMKQQEIEAAAAASLAAEKKRLEAEAAKKKQQELAAAAASLNVKENPPPPVAPQARAPVVEEEQPQVVAAASQEDMPRSKLMELAMQKYKELGGPIDAELAKSLPKPTPVVGGIPKGAEVPVAAENATPQSVFEVVVQMGGEVLSAEDVDSISRTELMELAMKKYKEMGPIDAELAKTLPKPTGVVGGIPKSAEVSVASESATPQSVFKIVVQMGGDVLPAEDAVPRDELMDLAMKKYKEIGPIDADLAKYLPKPARVVAGGIPRGAEVVVAGEHATPQSVFEVVVQMGGDVLTPKDAAPREQLMELAMKKFEESGPIDAELAKRLPKPTHVEGGIPLAAEVVVAGEHATIESIFQVKVQLGGDVLRGEDSTPREKLMEVAMKKFQENGPIDNDLAKSRKALMASAMKKYKETGPIDAELAKNLPKPTPVVGGIPRAAEVAVAAENTAPASVFDSTVKQVDDKKAENVAKAPIDVYNEADVVPMEELMEAAMQKFKEMGPLGAGLSKTLPKVKAVMGGIPKAAEVAVARENVTPESLLKSVVLLGGDLLSAEDAASREILMNLAMEKFMEIGPIDSELAKSPPKPTGVVGGIPKGAEVAASAENTTLEGLFRAETSAPSSAYAEWKGTESSDSAFKQEMDHAMHKYSNPVIVQMGGDLLGGNVETSRDGLMEIAMEKFKETGPIDAELSKTLPNSTAVVGGIPKDAEIPVSGTGMTAKELCQAVMPSIDASDPVWTGHESTETSQSVFKQEMDHAMHEYSNPATVELGGGFLHGREAISREELMDLAMEKFKHVGPIDAELSKNLPKVTGVVDAIFKDAEISVSHVDVTAKELCQAAVPLVDPSDPVWTGSECSESVFQQEMDHATNAFLNPVLIDVGGDIRSVEGAATREQLMMEAMDQFKERSPAEATTKAPGVFGGIPDGAEVPAIGEDSVPDLFFEFPEVSASAEVWVGEESSTSVFEPVMDKAAHDFANPPVVQIGGEINTEPMESLMESAMEKYKRTGPLDAGLAKALPNATATTEGLAFSGEAELNVTDESTTPESILEAMRPPKPKSVRTWIGSISSRSAFKVHMDQAAKNFLNPVMVRIGGDIITGEDAAASEGLLSRAELMEAEMKKFKKMGPADAELSKSLPNATGVPGGIPVGAEVPVAEESTSPKDLWDNRMASESFEYDTEWFQKVQNGIPPPFQFVTQDACWSNSRCWEKLRSQRDSSVDYDVVLAGDSPDLFAAMALQLKGFDVCLLVGADLDIEKRSRHFSEDEFLGLKELGVLSDEEIDTAGDSPSVLMDRVAKRFQAWGGTIMEQSPLVGVAISEYVGAAVDLGDAREVVTASLIMDCLGSESPMACQERYGKESDDGKPVSFSWSRMLAVSSQGPLIPLARRISDAVSDALETQRLHRHDMAEINSYLHDEN